MRCVALRCVACVKVVVRVVMLLMHRSRACGGYDFSNRCEAE